MELSLYFKLQGIIKKQSCQRLLNTFPSLFVFIFYSLVMYNYSLLLLVIANKCSSYINVLYLYINLIILDILHSVGVAFSSSVFLLCVHSFFSFLDDL